MTTVKFRCGACLHYKQHAHPSHGSVCSKLGVKHYGVAPRCFTPDVTQLADNNEDLASLALTFGTLSHKQRTIMLAILMSSTSKRPFPLGQKLYFRAVGADYISNYLSGYVMGYTSSKQVILAGSPEVTSRGKMYTAYLDSKDLLLPTRWAKHRAMLSKAGRFVDPKHPLLTKKKIDIDHEPPTIDKAPKKWHDDNEKKARRASRKAAGTTIVKLAGE